MLTRIIVALVLAVLAAVVVVVLGFGDMDGSRLALGNDVSVRGVLQAAGLLFFAFAGYARIATLGEEVRDPARTIPRAIPIALGIALLVYAIVAVTVLGELGSAALASATAPLADAVRAAGLPSLEPVVRVGAAVAALGSLLALILGVSRTTLAMARDRHLPHALAAVHPRFKSPHRAEVVVGVVVAVVAALVDVRGAIGFSSFAVLMYYAIANASAWTLEPEGRRHQALEPEGRRHQALEPQGRRHQVLRRKFVPFLGLVGCLVLAVFLPVSSVLVGAAVVAVGAAAYLVSAPGRPASGS
jgi:basic amino acid/polyamine antiporter, APA family